MRTRPPRRGRSLPLSAVALALASLLAAPPAAAAPRKTGTVVVRCPVDGASVFVDGEEIGTLPLDPLAIQFGRHTVRVVRNGLIDFSKDIMLRPGEELVITALPPKAMSLLTIQTGVAGAEVLVDGKVVGKTPIRELPINPGNHSMFLRKEGLQPYKEDFRVPPNREYVSKPALKTRDGKPAGQDDFGLAALDLSMEAKPASDGLGLGGLDLEPVAPAPKGKPGKTPEPAMASLDLSLEPVAPPPKGKPGKTPEPAMASLDLGLEPSLDMGLDLELPAAPPPPKTGAKPGKGASGPPTKAGTRPPPAKVATRRPPPEPPPPAKVAARRPPPEPPPPAFTLPPEPLEPPPPPGPPFYTRTWFQATAGGVAGAAALTAVAAYVVVPLILYGEIGPKPYAERHDPNAKCPDCLIVLNR